MGIPAGVFSCAAGAAGRPAGDVVPVVDRFRVGTWTNSQLRRQKTGPKKTTGAGGAGSVPVARGPGSIGCTWCRGTWCRDRCRLDVVPAGRGAGWTWCRGRSVPGIRADDRRPAQEPRRGQGEPIGCRFDSGQGRTVSGLSGAVWGCLGRWWLAVHYRPESGAVGGGGQGSTSVRMSTT